jgi:hypothetical protein
MMQVIDGTIPDLRKNDKEKEKKHDSRTNLAHRRRRPKLSKERHHRGRRQYRQRDGDGADGVDKVNDISVNVGSLKKKKREQNPGLADQHVASPHTAAREDKSLETIASIDTRDFLIDHIPADDECRYVRYSGRPQEREVTTIARRSRYVQTF